MQKIIPYLWFNRNAEDAMNFYVSVFKNGKILSIERYPDSVPPGPMEGFEGKVLNGLFEIDGQQFLAIDGGPMFSFTEAISFHVTCEDQAEVDYLWGKLSARPESEQCGWLKDKFGMSWQIIPKRFLEMMNDGDAEQKQRTMEAMLQMKKFDVAALEQAYQGN